MKEKKDVKNTEDKKKIRALLYVLFHKMYRYLEFYSFPKKIRNKIISIVTEFLIDRIPSDFKGIKKIKKINIIKYCKKKFGNIKEKMNYLILLKVSSLFNFCICKFV